MKYYFRSIYKLLALLFFLGMMLAHETQAQTFFGYQTIGRNTVFFSIAWQGKPFLGVGYNLRSFGKTFMDTQAELRFPIDKMYTFSDFQLIAGTYKPLAMKRAFIGAGGHFRLKKETVGTQKTTSLSLAITGMPSLVYAANIADGAYGTIGLRITYAPVLFASQKGGETNSGFQVFPTHTFEGGGHFGLHHERTIGLGLNGFVSKSIFSKNSILSKDTSWRKEGDFYLGTTYRLSRN